MAMKVPFFQVTLRKKTPAKGGKDYTQNKLCVVNGKEMSLMEL